MAELDGAAQNGHLAKSDTANANHYRKSQQQTVGNLCLFGDIQLLVHTPDLAPPSQNSNSRVQFLVKDKLSVVQQHCEYGHYAHAC